MSIQEPEDCSAPSVPPLDCSLLIFHNQSEELTLLWTRLQMVRKAWEAKCVPVRGEDVVASSVDLLSLLQVSLP